ncbi:SAF domain-containing protein [Cellulomonas sp. URHE0023]|uniref:SAF domain-containing protein n=1 Tax=Cellulomonas sp. URHE0023 TaxID=1380354 RepID=UPI0009DF49E9|nr:SAF domain-containing protein [Cellulomonas sp. URHE0023]
MTATSQKTTLNGAPARAALHAPSIASPRGRRRPMLVIAGIVMVVVGALAAVWLVSSSGHRTHVVVMARDVAYGTPISATDLTTTAVAVDPSVATIPAAQAGDLVGQVAVTSLPRGTLLARADLTSDGVVGADEVLVPLPLSAERVPAGGLAGGDRVLVVDAPAQGADPVAGTPTSTAATVVRVSAPDINGMVVADVVATTEDGPVLATRAATGRFALVVLPPQGSK